MFRALPDGGRSLYSLSWKKILLWSFLFLFSVGALSLHNQYPYYYHPDEFGKAKQVVQRRYNYHHPMLTVMSASMVHRAKIGDRTSLQRAVRIGRTLSAIFCSIGILALVWVLSQQFGLILGLGAFFAFLTNPLLFEIAHLFKEDSALFMSLCLVILSSWHVLREKGRNSAAWVGLGMSVGLAFSSKYVGILFVLFAFTTSWSLRREKECMHGWKKFALVIGSFILTLCVINLPMLTNYSDWMKSFDREFSQVVHGHRGVIRKDSWSYYWDIHRHALSWLVTGSYLAYLAWLVMKGRERSLWNWMIGLMVPIQIYMLLSSPKMAERYYFPVLACCLLGAFLWIGEASRLLRSVGKAQMANVFQCGVISLILLFQMPNFLQLEREFQVNDRVELEVWMRENLPAGSNVVQDFIAGLPDRSDHRQKNLVREFPHHVEGAEFVADLGSLEELKARGVEYVAISEAKFSRYLGNTIPAPGSEAVYERRRAFYQALVEEGELMWSRPPSRLGVLHPGIRLYRLPRASS